MDKKELYEHLARIYLDSSKKHQRKKKKHHYLIETKHLYIGIIVFILVLIPFILIKLSPFYKKQAGFPEYRTALIIQPDAVKMNYNFIAAKKEVYTLPLKGLDLNTYKALAFAVRRARANSSASLRIEVVNALNERAEVYIKDVLLAWKEYKMELSSFKKITDWSKTKELLFIAEEWNTREKNDVIYIENVRFLK